MIRFYNGKVLTFDNGVKISDTDEVWTDGSKISYVGPFKEQMPEFDREVDLKGNVLMPSFKNAHTHTAMTFLRSYADDLPLDKWLNTMIFPAEAKLTHELLYTSTKIGIMEYLTSGISASFDMYFKNETYVKANIESGFRTVIVSSMNNFDADMTLMEEEYLKYNSCNDLVSYFLGNHAEYTTSLDRLEYVAGLVQKYKAPFFSHNSETKSEVEGCISRYGKTPTQLYDSLGVYDYGGGGYHCVWFNDEDIEIFKKHNCYVVTNPASNAKLASGIAPITKFMEKGVNLAIGTDGASSNNALDMFREMYLIMVLQKLQNMDAAACDPEKVLEMACVGGARAMNLYDCDNIAVGKKADMIVIDLMRPNMQPVHNIVKNIVYSGSKDNVKMTMINGVIRYEDGKFYIGDDPSAIYEENNRLIKEQILGK